MKVLFTYPVLLFSLTINILGQGSLPAPIIRYSGFDITNGNIEVRWEPVSDSRVEHYKIKYYYPPSNGFSGGWNDVFTDARVEATEEPVINFSPEGFRNVNPNNQPVLIGVYAYPSNTTIEPTPLDTSIFDYTLHLTADWDSCHTSITFSWSDYYFKQWPQPGNEEFQLFASTDGGTTYNLLTQIPNNENTYVFENVPPNIDYTFYLSAISANSPGDSANSNLVSINTDMSIMPEYIYANYATNENGLAEISFSIDPTSETKEYNVLRRHLYSSSFDTIANLITSEKIITHIDPSDYYQGPYSYILEAINNCGVNIRQSENMASTILLKQQGAPLTPELLWNNYKNWLNEPGTYTLLRNFGDNDNDAQNLSAFSDTVYIDRELSTLVENNLEAQVCYTVYATDNNQEFNSFSNKVCYELPVNIRFEYDAFNPGGGTDNNRFGPTLDFLPNEYKFTILDRNGQLVYKSEDPENTHWDGYINGSLAPQGAYMGILQYRVSTGKKKTIHTGIVVVH